MTADPHSRNAPPDHGDAQDTSADGMQEDESAQAEPPGGQAPQKEQAPKKEQDPQMEPAEQAPAPTEGADGAETPGDPAVDLEQQLEAVNSKMAEQHDKFLRLHAEFDNYKKRIQKEHEDRVKYAPLSLMKDLAAVIDNLERALGHAADGQNDNAEGLRSGIEMVAKQFIDTVERHHMMRFEAKGLPFDPTVHEAMTVVEMDQGEDNQVIEVFQTGYKLYERVVRPAMVSVSKRSGDSREPPEADETG